MPTYTVRDGHGTTISEIGPNSLLRFLRDCTDQAELRRDDWPGQAIIARPTAQRWQIEIVNGDSCQVATVPNIDAALDTMRSWAEEDGWLSEAFTWTPLTGTDGAPTIAHPEA